jgi:hypothetical protein
VARCTSRIGALLKCHQRNGRWPSLQKGLPLDIDVVFDATECSLRSVIRYHAELTDRWVAGVSLDHKRVQYLWRHSINVFCPPPE